MDHEVRGVPEEAQHPVRRGANTRAALAAYARTPAVLIAGAITLAVVIGVVLWLLLRGGGEEAKPSQRAPATAASIQRLNAFVSSVGHPIYWVGSQPRFTYELSRTKDGRVYIRYLPPGVKLGNSNPNYLTVGTYPQPHAFATLRATAKNEGVQTIQLAGGGLAFQYKSRPTSVYLAYPESDYQIEVFDPSPAAGSPLWTTSIRRASTSRTPTSMCRSRSTTRLLRARDNSWRQGRSRPFASADGDLAAACSLRSAETKGGSLRSPPLYVSVLKRGD